MDRFQSKKFIKATKEYATYERQIPAPLFRRAFEISTVQNTELCICGLGFYRLFLNGVEITAGKLATHVYNPDDFLYYDEYDVTPYLTVGKNVIGVVLGNGFLNNIGGGVWRLDDAPFRDAPKLALNLFADGKLVLEADERFLTAPSAILFNDVRSGELFDARNFDERWNQVDYDDSAWTPALFCDAPKGAVRKFDGTRIRAFEELKATSITKRGKAYVYDFGKCLAGVCRLRLKGERGKVVRLVHCELTDETGEPYQNNITFPKHRKYPQQQIEYICKGDSTEEYTPSFTYFCFRYVVVYGVEESEATEDLLTFCVMHADVPTVGSFSCSDGIANKIQSMTIDSDLSNLFHYPNDCSHREKNGWTADASLSIEQMILNFDVQKLFKEWYRTLVAAQREDGAVPCIAPTTGYGFDWGNGPAWDSALAYVPYYLYRYYHDEEAVQIAAPALVKYLRYLHAIRKENGLVEKGLTDWCEVTDDDCFRCSTKLEVVSTLISADIAQKSAFLLARVGAAYAGEAAGAEKLQRELLQAFRKKYVYPNACRVKNFTQCAQAMAIAVGVFLPSERAKAAKKLAELVEKQGEKMLFGVWGSRFVFRILAEYGYQDLAWKMIVRTDEKSYGYMAKHDWNTLWEKIVHAPDDMHFKYSYKNRCTSYNHHFWGDVSAFFLCYVCGIVVNPTGDEMDEVVVRPHFVKDLSFANGEYTTRKGKIVVDWKKKNGQYLLNVRYPKGLSVKIVAKNAVVTTQEV